MIPGTEGVPPYVIEAALERMVRRGIHCPRKLALEAQRVAALWRTKGRAALDRPYDVVMEYEGIPIIVGIPAAAGVETAIAKAQEIVPNAEVLRVEESNVVDRGQNA